MRIKSRITGAIYNADNTLITCDCLLVSELIKLIEPIDCFYDEKRDCLFYVFEREQVEVMKRDGYISIG